MPDNDWNIKSRSNCCNVCNTPFEDKQTFASKLIFTKNGYERLDCCENCWNTREEQEGMVSFWRGVYHAPPPPEQETLKKETAESLLRTLINKNNPAYTNSIYILAAMLERKRLLVEKVAHKDETGLLRRIYEHKKTGETFAITDPMLKLDQIEHVQKEVSELLEKGIPETDEPIDASN